MSSTATTISAAAASLAAVLAAINLYITGRRERAKWAREVLQDAFMHVLDSSFRAKDRCKKICRLEQAYDMDEEQRQLLVAEVDSAVEAILSQISRLRLLAPKYVIDASLALVDANRRFRVAATGEPTSVVVLDDTFHRARIREARDQVIAAAKRFMQIP